MMNADITVTAAAEHYFTNFLKEYPSQGLRLSTKISGCSGHAYVLDVVDLPHESDLTIPMLPFSFYVDAIAYEKALKGLVIDYQQDALSSAIVYRNPNEKGACGCGESFTL
ncbi:MAG: iron-sulfur cluster assembly accessory protein [Zetaproteobacteria bacterium]|nr:iron-sulfur cluster assembly accessory protein [Zetaproteobacteria bacterium]